VTGTGLTVNHDGYLRIKKRGPFRDWMAHRFWVSCQIGRPLLPAEEVHHVCMNRACWPPTDFHLCLCDAVLAPYMFQAHGTQKFRRRA